MSRKPKPKSLPKPLRVYHIVHSRESLYVIGDNLFSKGLDTGGDSTHVEGFDFYYCDTTTFPTVDFFESVNHSLNFVGENYKNQALYFCNEEGIILGIIPLNNNHKEFK